jgi:hypothetical protein
METPNPLGSMHLRSPPRLGPDAEDFTVGKSITMTTQFMDAGARNWLFRHANKNHWRVAAWMDLDDLIQEGYIEYCEVLKRYPQAVEASHKMRLFQLCFRSKIEDLVRANTKQVDDARSDILEIYDGDAILVPDFSNLHALLIKAPQVIKDALTLLADDKQREELVKPFTRYDNGRRETLNERMCKLLNIDSSKVDVVGQMKNYFASV